MAAFQHVLFACDFSAGSEIAAEHVKLLGRRFGGRALLVYVQASAWKHWRTSGGIERQTRERAKRWAKSLSREGVDTRALVASGSPTEVILGLASSEPAIDLIVVGQSGASRFERAVVGPTAETLARFATQPVWVSHPATRRVAKVLCGIDGSPGSRRALELAGELAAGFDAELVVASALVEPPLNPTGMSEDEISQARQRYRVQRVHELDGFVDTCQLAGRRVERQYLWGQPDEVLVELAHDGRYDVLVAGRTGHSLLQRVLLGSTAHRLVRRAPCSLLLVGHAKEDI